MVRYYCKSILLGVIFGVIICLEARPANNNAQAIRVPSKSDSLQILQLNSLDSVSGSNGKLDAEGRQTISLGASLSSGLHIPVQVIYDSPTPMQKYATKSNDATVKLINLLSPSSSSISMVPHRRNSKQLDFSKKYDQGVDIDKNNIDAIDDDLEKLHRGTDELPLSPNDFHPAISLVVPELRESTQSVEKDESSAPGGITNTSTNDEPSVTSVPPAADDVSNDTSKRIQAVLARLREVTNTEQDAMSKPPFVGPVNGFPPNYYYDASHLSPYLVGSPPIPPYFHDRLIYDYYTRQWSSPFSNYFPIVIRDPFQSALNYFSDLLEYGPAADVCQLRRDNGYRSGRSLNRRQKRNVRSSKKGENRGKHHFVLDANLKRKDASTTTPTPAVVSETKQIKVAQPKQGLFGQANEPANNVRGTDVGPQISKLIVRRGGVAIAGAGGIATAGSGGTAIVGPGGTAFTTPASSGGVAMVGPGGKVVKVPDLTNVLYGRTNANVAATGAGHTTFTTKDGQVFTTSDNTGGVALVNPDGGLLGVKDDENLRLQMISLQQQQQQQEQLQQDEAKAQKTNEVQLPAGARLLTTGPIIYYNPVYPAVAAPLR